MMFQGPGQCFGRHPTVTLLSGDRLEDTAPTLGIWALGTTERLLLLLPPVLLNG